MTGRTPAARPTARSTGNWSSRTFPGPRCRSICFGREIEAIYPFVPLLPQGHALSIGVVSYNGGVFFGLAGDRDVLSDMDSLAADLALALDELIRAAGLEPKRTAYPAE